MISVQYWYLSKKITPNWSYLFEFKISRSLAKLYHIVAHVNYSISALCSNVVFIIITHRITKIYRSPFLKILKMMKYKCN